ncbi:aminoglycoside phosphotransferase (APT) family kinase protein [Mycolicibacterium sp. BK556]|uniref:phosphotransferase family protein n=1 Tax=unclassified Mycolicibacterium TaxID=2636767 RepID=UPI0016098D8D|nr:MULTISPECIES: phosphotransferase family protein [unclassified Mycolicibacterium]MBB3600973.1 aminoglycoside phosphotransferase (APT) family kinase protein [Mycolicibacterium sp. BK556]MBB3630727.1 aminoglycoside phosphotransferase (APT) family kinase protein [Mycolicibacterium sp. BK607]
MTEIPELAQRLTSWLRKQIADDVRVEGLDRVDFGHSAEMLTVTIVAAERTDVVLRLRPRPPALLEPYDLPRQFRILSALSDTAVRAPKVLWLEDSGDVLGRPFLVMERVAGDVYEMQAPERAGDAGIRRMCEGMAEQLAAVHTVDLTATGLDWLGDGRDHLDREIAHWADEMRRVQRGPLPALERLLAELRASMPERYPAVTLVHGDAKPGNFAFVGDEVSAVFDWELTGTGDPLTDLGWMELLWMQPVGITSHPAAISFDEFLAHYQAASGITPRNRPWYRALNAFKMAVICLIGSTLYDSGDSDDERFLLNAHGISLLTQLGLAELGVAEKLDDGPVLPSR